MKKMYKGLLGSLIIISIFMGVITNLYIPFSYATGTVDDIKGTTEEIPDVNPTPTPTPTPTPKPTPTKKPVKLATQRGYVKAVSTVTLRKKASTKGKWVATLKAGQKVYVLGTTKSGWYKIKTTKKKVGYVKKKYIGTKTNKKYKLLATYTTYSRRSPSGRNYNMKKAAKKIKKITLKKGKTFNWFSVVGPCGKKQGYKVANVIISGKVLPGYGGGVCQVATTMYGCSRKLNMKKIERHNHSAKVSYLNKDRYEAAVSYGHNNLRFKNTTKKNIVFDLYVSSGRVIVAAYQVL